MVGADDSTELWRHPNNTFSLAHQFSQFFVYIGRTDFSIFSAQLTGLNLNQVVFLYPSYYFTECITVESDKLGNFSSFQFF